MNGGVSGKSVGSGAVVSNIAAVEPGSVLAGEEGGKTCGFAGCLGGKPRYPSGDKKGYWCGEAVTGRGRQTHINTCME